MYNAETLIYPHVLASTVSGPVAEAPRETRYFAQAVTNNMDTVVRTSVYWFIPEDGSEPVLVIEIDDEEIPGMPDNMDIKIRVRRNDGLIYEGNRASQENLEEL